MNHFSFELSLIAVLPALALCGYVFFKDRVEKEPIGLLALLFGVGAVGYIPSVFIEHFILSCIDKRFASSFTASAEGFITFSSEKEEVLYLSLCAFLGFSVIRICIMWLIIFLITHKNKNFNYLFDGIVYSVFVSLGFAVSENLHFILQNNVELLLPKLITSVCCQLFIGIIMGYFYTMWNMRFTANYIEKKLLKAGVVEKDNIKPATPWFVASIVVPMLISGLYYLAGSLKNDNVAVVFYTAVFFIFGASFLTVNQIAKKDVSYGKYLYRIIAKGHNKITPRIIEQVMAEDLFDDEEVLGE